MPFKILSFKNVSLLKPLYSDIEGTLRLLVLPRSYLIQLSESSTPKIAMHLITYATVTVSILPVYSEQVRDWSQNQQHIVSVCACVCAWVCSEDRCMEKVKL